MTDDNDLATSCWCNVTETANAPSSGNYLELPESGWGALVGWVAGVDQLVRCPDRIEWHTTRITVTENGVQHHIERPRSTTEQSEVDDDINEYLHAAGVPSRPSGYRWFLQLPPDYTEALFWECVNRHLSDHPEAIRPAAVAYQLRIVIEDAYRSA